MSKSLFVTLASTISSQYTETLPPLSAEVSLSIIYKYLILDPCVSQVCGGIIADFLTSTDDVAVVSRDAGAIVNISSRGLYSTPSVSFTKDCNGIVSIAGGLVATRGEGIVVLDDTFESDREFTQPGHQVLCLAASPDGELFATGGSDASVAIWSLHEGQVRYFTGHSDWVRFIAFVHIWGDIRIATASDDGCACLWDVKSGHLSTLEFSGGVGIRAFDVSLGGVMGISSETPNLSIYTLGDDQFHMSGAIQRPHNGTLTACKVVESMGVVVTAAEDEIVVVSCLRTFRPLWKCTALVTKRRCISFMNTVTSIRIIAAPPSSSVMVVVACASDGTVLQWVIDPRDDRHTYARTVQLHIGALIGLDPVQS